MTADDEAAALGPLASSTIGSGARPVVLLHGFLGSGRNLRALALAWAQASPDRRFLLADLSGHGDSPLLPPDASMDDMGRVVLETAERASFGPPFTLVGHSLGGRVALAAARVAPAVIAEVVLVDIAPGEIDPQRSESRRVLDVLLAAPTRVPNRRDMRTFLIGRGLTPALADWLMMNLRSDGDAYSWRIDPHALDGFHERFNRDDFWSVVEARSVPVRCIRGGRSRYVTEADVARFRDAGCRVDTLPDAGHFVHVDALEGLVALLAGR